jgi:tetratricopeptide (TPR) repeat protein
MGGDATFSGTTYQAKVIAFVYVHVLAKVPLGWLTNFEDIPISVEGETEGPGDDIRIHYSNHPPVEVQAKHGLTAGERLREAIARVKKRSASDDKTKVLFATNRASRTVYEHFRRDLDRLRSDRTDGLKKEIAAQLKHVGNDHTFMKRLFVVGVDIDDAQHSEAKYALHSLRTLLADHEQATAAWALLVADAGEICAKKMGRTRVELVNLLSAANIHVGPVALDAQLNQRLDGVRELLKKRQASAALTLVRGIAKGIGDTEVEPATRHRLVTQEAIALLQQDRYEKALTTVKQALDIDGDGLAALQTAADCSALMGANDAALKYAKHCVEAHPEKASAWGTLHRVSVIAGAQLPAPAAPIASEPEFRLVIADMAHAQGDWSGVLNVTKGLLADDVRSAEVLFLHANARLAERQGVGEAVERGRLEDVVRFSTELIDKLDDESHPLTHKGMVIRGTALHLLGRKEDSHAELELARTLAPSDLDRIRNTAIVMYEDGNIEGALEELHSPAVTDDALLLAMRAELLVPTDAKRAAFDLERSLQLARSYAHKDQVFRAAAEVALKLGNQNQAEETLDLLSPEGAAEGPTLALRARLAFAQGDVAQGRELYRNACNAADAHGDLFLLELASKLFRADLAAEAVGVFEEIGVENIPDEAAPDYALALLKANELVKAQALARRLLSDGSPPRWVYRLAVELALRQEDYEAAIKHLMELRTEGVGDPEILVTLCGSLVQRGRNEDAEPYLRQLESSTALTPIQQVHVAQLLHAIGQSDDAFELAFRALRRGPGDSRVHRVFVSLGLSGQIKIEEIKESGPKTSILLRSTDGKSRQYSIFAEPPIDPVRHEISLADATKVGLIGKKVGDTVVHNEGGWRESAYEVVQVVPAKVYALREAMEHYEERFPGESFFVKGFKVGNEGSVSDFAPIISSAQARSERISLSIKLYREKTLPLGFLSTLLGGSLADAMQYLSSQAEGARLLVEWSNSEGQDESLATALDANEVILTRSALETSHRFDLLSVVRDHFEIFAPNSLDEELRIEKQEAERAVRDGVKIVAWADGRLQAIEIEPGHTELQAKVDHLSNLRKFLSDNVTLCPRPLEVIGTADSEEEDMREIIGQSSYDALKLTTARSAALYADDLGLRRFLLGGKGRSFSTASLFPALTQMRLITPSRRDQGLLKLVLANFLFVRPQSGLLESALADTGLSNAELRLVFETLGGPILNLGESARLAAHLVKAAALKEVQLVTPGKITNIALNGMAKRWSPQACAMAIRRALEAELLLLPNVLDEVREVCAKFGKQK